MSKRKTEEEICGWCGEARGGESETVFLDAAGEVYTERPRWCGDPGSSAEFCRVCFLELKEEEAEEERESAEVREALAEMNAQGGVRR